MAMRGALKGVAWRSLEWNRLRVAAPRLGSCRGCATIADEGEKDRERAPGAFFKLCESIAEKPQETTRIVKDWVSQGNRLCYKSYLKIVKSLAEHPRLYKEAVKLLRTSRDEKIVKSKSETLILELTLVYREFGVIPAQRFFARLPQALKTEDVIAAFVKCIAKRDPRKGVKWVEGLKPKTPDLYNAVIFLYWRVKMHEKMLAAYTALRENPKILPTVETYLLMLKFKERLGGMDGLEKEVEQVVNQIDLNTADVFMLDHLMEIYAYLGDADKVEEIWKLVKAPQPPFLPLRNSFSVAIRSFGLLHKVRRAEEVLQESRAVTQRIYQAECLIEVYCKEGMLEKAEELLEAIDRSKRTFAPYNALILGYLARGDTEKALKKFREGCLMRAVLPSYETVVALLPVFEERKFCQSTECLMQNYLNLACGDIRVYHGLLKVYIACQKVAKENLLARFKIKFNDETRALRKSVIKPVADDAKKSDGKQNEQSLKADGKPIEKAAINQSLKPDERSKFASTADTERKVERKRINVNTRFEPR